MDGEAPAKPAHVDARMKARLNARLTGLKADRSQWLSEWRDIAAHMRPRSFREHTTDANRGERKHQSVINSTPLEAARTLAAGMMAGITSPSRPWFRLTVTGEPGLSEAPGVRQWLSDVEGVMREALARSNAYKALHLVYADLGPFGVSVLVVEEDEEDEVRCYVFPVGSYCLSSSARGSVDTLFREVSLTVGQLESMFGEEACSQAVRDACTAGRVDTRVDVAHAILPNDKHVEGAFGVAGKKWLSMWWESNSAPEAPFLRVSGYDEFPAMAPRWEVVGEDCYGHGPGHAALGDCRALQLLERRAAQAADRVANPPMQAPTAAATRKLSLAPGEWNFVDSLGQGAGVRPAIVVDPRAVDVLELKIRQHEQRIRKTFFADLWLLLSESSGAMTAREVMERREEKLLQLGTVLEALQDELLDPLVDRIFAILLRRGRIPEPPEQLQGRELKVEYISILAQAQKLLSTTGLERLAAFAGNLAQLEQPVLDKLDMDQLVDEYADSLGVTPNVVRPDDVVEARRQARAAAQQQAEKVQLAAQAADVGKKLGDTSLESGTALDAMLRGVGAR